MEETGSFRASLSEERDEVDMEWDVDGTTCKAKTKFTPAGMEMKITGDKKCAQMMLGSLKHG